MSHVRAQAGVAGRLTPSSRPRSCRRLQRGASWRWPSAASRCSREPRRGRRGRRSSARRAARGRARARRGRRGRRRRSSGRSTSAGSRTWRRRSRRPCARCTSTPVPSSAARWRSRAATTRVASAADEAGGRREELGVGALHGDEQVDAVEQRAAEAAAVARELAPRCSGSARAAAKPHGHGLVAATSMKRAGKTARALAADDRHAAVLQRLAQRLERRPRELGQLVEEQHAVVGELASPGAGTRRRRPAPRRRWCGAARGTAARRPARRRGAGRRRCGCA